MRAGYLGFFFLDFSRVYNVQPGLKNPWLTPCFSPAPSAQENPTQGPVDIILSLETRRGRGGGLGSVSQGGLSSLRGVEEGPQSGLKFPSARTLY